MDNMLKQQHKLLQKKAKLAREEINYKINARKLRTKQLIAIGTLIAKAGIDFLPTATFFGGLLSLKAELDLASNNEAQNENIIANWTKKGDNALMDENKHKVLVILKLSYNEYLLAHMILRKYRLKWNNHRREWYGYVDDITALQQELAITAVDINDPNKLNWQPVT